MNEFCDNPSDKADNDRPDDAHEVSLMLVQAQVRSYSNVLVRWLTSKPNASSLVYFVPAAERQSLPECRRYPTCLVRNGSSAAPSADRCLSHWLGSSHQVSP